MPKGKLFQTIRQLVAEGHYVVGEHANERLEERGILRWQVEAAFADAVDYRERPKSKPNPSIEVTCILPDGVEFNAVWSLLKSSGTAKLVTVHFFDEGYS